MAAVELPGICVVNAVGTSVNVTTTSSGSYIALPTNANGDPPKIVRVAADGFCHIRFSTALNASPVCSNNDILINPNGNPDYFNVKGNGFFSVKLDTAHQISAVLNICAVEL